MLRRIRDPNIRLVYLAVFLLGDCELLACHSKLDLEQPFVNRTELPDAKRFEVDWNQREALRVFIARKQIKGRREKAIGNLVLR